MQEDLKDKVIRLLEEKVANLEKEIRGLKDGKITPSSPYNPPYRPLGDSVPPQHIPYKIECLPWITTITTVGDEPYMWTTNLNNFCVLS